MFLTENSRSVEIIIHLRVAFSVVSGMFQATHTLRSELMFRKTNMHNNATWHFNCCYISASFGWTSADRCALNTINCPSWFLQEMKNYHVYCLDNVECRKGTHCTDGWSAFMLYVKQIRKKWIGANVFVYVTRNALWHKCPKDIRYSIWYHC